MRPRHLLYGAVLAIIPQAAHPHPHEFIDAAAEIVFDTRGRVQAIRHHWRFDEGFSAFALQGLDSNGDGAYSPEELRPLARENVEALAEYGYFTTIDAGGQEARFAPPSDYALDLEAAQLTLHYTLPLSEPLAVGSELVLRVYDPDYYIAFSFPSQEAARLVGAPADCLLDVHPAAGPDPQAAAALADVGPEQRDLPADLQAMAGNIDNRAIVACGARAAAAMDGGREAATAGEAASAMAAGSTGDLRALPAASAPATPADDAARAAASAERRSGGILQRLAALQVQFHRSLTDALKALASDATAFWWLGGISFLYGIVHAAGPGHGKLVISSYLVANEQTVRRGVGIAFVSAFAQAVVAVALIGALAAVLDMTSMAIKQAARFLEAGSYALILGLGLTLLARKSATAWAGMGSGHGHVHAGGRQRHHGHAHGPDCGCRHHAAPAALARPGIAGAAAAVLSVGVRPCSGALIVLVFALAQGVFWAGIASTFLMAVGTGLTVAALAALTVGAKDLAGRLARSDGRRAAQVMTALEIAAALLVTALGAVLLAGTLLS